MATKLAAVSASPQVLRIGSVSFLNSKPLIFGLEDAADVDLQLDVPSRLLDGLRTQRFDVALLPVIDYQRMDGLRVLTSGGIGCDGPTLTVRIFSRIPIARIDALACDTDSHTSVALARVVLAEQYGIRPEFVALEKGSDTVAAAPRRVLRTTASDPSSACPARLLIGDKVVCEEPQGFEHQLDLGAAWKGLTGLPFVFALWMARKNVELRDLPQRLETAKKQGMANIEQIIQRHALPRGWPADVAHRYLCEYLQYDIGPRQLQAIAHFHRLAAKHGMIASAVRPLEIAL
jgi:chorismate dehydratase